MIFLSFLIDTVPDGISDVFYSNENFRESQIYLPLKARHYIIYTMKKTVEVIS